MGTIAELEQRVVMLERGFDKMANLVQPLILKFEIELLKEKIAAEEMCETLSKNVIEGQTMGVWDE